MVFSLQFTSLIYRFGGFFSCTFQQQIALWILGSFSSRSHCQNNLRWMLFREVFVLPWCFSLIKKDSLSHQEILSVAQKVFQVLLTSRQMWGAGLQLWVAWVYIWCCVNSVHESKQVTVSLWKDGTGIREQRKVWKEAVGNSKLKEESLDGGVWRTLAWIYQEKHSVGKEGFESCFAETWYSPVPFTWPVCHYIVILTLT